MLLKLAISLFAALVLYGLYRAARVAKKILSSPLRDLPGPRSESMIWGNLRSMWDKDFSTVSDKWLEDHGPTIAFRGFLNQRHLVTTDTKALSFILTHTDDFQKGKEMRENMRQLFGNGLLVVEGEQHRRHRRILNPAFGPAQTRALTDIFLDKAIELRDIWFAQISDSTSPVPTKDVSKVGLHGDAPVKVLGRKPSPGEALVDVLDWLSRATLDVIGRAGFNYELHSLKNDGSIGEEDELAKSFAFILKARDITIGLILRELVPLLKKIVPSAWEIELARAHATMSRIGMRLINDARREAEKGNDGGGKDLLSLLVKANMSEGRGTMSDEEILAQVPTFLTAGHETTSSAVTWALYALCKYPHIQSTLRAELAAVNTDRPSMDDLNALEYLDSVVREVMRLYAPVPSTIRAAERDVVVPVDVPYIDNNGIERDGIRMKKGDMVFIPILNVNTSKELWGEDAAEFKPERWHTLPESVRSIPGVWSNMLSFIGGPRACIGYRFSLVEMKAFLFTLIRAFEFELAVPVDDIGSKHGIVQKPTVLSDPGKPNQMPMIVRPVKEV